MVISQEIHTKFLLGTNHSEINSYERQYQYVMDVIQLVLGSIQRYRC